MSMINRPIRALSGLRSSRARHRRPRIRWNWTRAPHHAAAVAAVLMLTGSGQVTPVNGLVPENPPAPEPGTPVGVTGGSSLYLERPPVHVGPAPALPGAARLASSTRQPVPYLDRLGIPVTVLRAYREAASYVHRSDPGCRLPVALLAAIGRVESHHANRGNVDRWGTTLSPILGPRLDGSGHFAAIRDSDRGRYDGDTVWDRAVGPMQFIPGTWSRWGVDGDGNGEASPHNVFDAALAAGGYLCAGDRDLRDDDDLRTAVLSYNHSTEYLQVVLEWMRVYDGGATAIPDNRAGDRAGGGGEPSRRSPAGSTGSTGRSDGATPAESSNPSQKPPRSSTPTRPGPSRPPTPPSPAPPAAPSDPTGVQPGQEAVQVVDDAVGQTPTR